MPSSKLREVTNSSSTGVGDFGPNTSTTGRRNFATNSRDSYEGGEILSGTRSRNAKKPVAYQEAEEDEDEDDEEEEEDDGQDEEGDEDADEEMDDYARLGAEAEATDDDLDADGEDDVEMEDAPFTEPAMVLQSPPTKARGSRVSFQKASRPPVKVTPSEEVQLKSVEEKEMEVDDEGEEEELSDLRSEGDEEEPDELGLGDEDAEGEDEELEGDIDAEGDEEGVGEGEEEIDSDDETPGSGTSTPDINKLTKRQRSRVDEGGDFLALPMEPQVKKILTADEHRMRRAEMARRRKNLSEKRNEEEKVCHFGVLVRVRVLLITFLKMTTISKLLTKQAPKRRGKAAKSGMASSAVPGDVTPNSQEFVEVEKPNPLYTRWVSTREGVKLGVPEEWLGKQAGKLFGDPPSQPEKPSFLVEEVES